MPAIGRPDWMAADADLVLGACGRKRLHIRTCTRRLRAHGIGHPPPVGRKGRTGRQDPTGRRAGRRRLRYFAADAPGYGFVNEATPELTVAVMKTYRNQGIGAQLVAHLQEHVSAISLSCDPANPAWRLYRWAGFEPMPDGRTLRWAGPR